ncbi:MAG TPA: hypothetical protein VNR39_17365 [Pseudolabrys sp.]|nr:hypothetical protein [Pseudolabrys sp.]
MSARREPTFHAAGRADDHHAPAPAVHPGQPIKSASHFTRFISGFQAVSTLIGVPLALASGYTLYRTNFAPETGCANLRSSIVSMLDKNVDPATRRMLVKRDVEAFERNCGGFDPDAQAAFRTLLATDKAVAQAAPAAAKPAPKPAVVARDVPKDDIKKAEPVKEAAKEAAKAELRPAIVEKKPVATAAVEPETPSEAAPMSDSRWLDAVRSALVEHPGDAETKAAPLKPKPQPVVASKPGEPVLQPNWTVTTPVEPPVAQGAAAPLPPAVAVSEPQRTIPADPNRPVPPAAIPAAQFAGGNGGANGGSNSHSWVAQIPFVGRIIEGSGN